MCKYTVRGLHCHIKVVLLCLICKICKSHCVCLVCGARRLPLGQPSGTRCQRTRALSKNLTKQTCLQPEALTDTLFLSRSLIPYYQNVSCLSLHSRPDYWRLWPFQHNAHTRTQTHSVSVASTVTSGYLHSICLSLCVPVWPHAHSNTANRWKLLPSEEDEVLR